LGYRTTGSGVSGIKSQHWKNILKGEETVQKIARFIITHSRSIIVLWILMLIVTSLLTLRVGAKFSDSLSLPQSDSQIASKLLAGEPAVDGLSSLQVVYASTTNAPLKPNDVNRIASAIARLPFVASISSPFVLGSQSISKDGKIAFSTIVIKKLSLSNRDEKIQKIIDTALAKNHSTIQIEFMGANNQKSGSSGSHTSEIIAILVSLFILILTFGSLTAAIIPIIVATTALFIASNLIGLLSNFFTTATFAPILSTLIGLGVGIDYALFIVSRFKQSLRESHSVEESILISLRTSGRAVIFAGLIVCLSILGLFAVGIEFLYGVAIATSISVLVTMCAAITLLPAILMLLGPRINLLAMPRFSRQDKKSRPENSKWQRWAGLIQRHPVKWAIASSILLILFFIPATTMHLGTADAGNNPANSTSRKAYDLMARGFGAGFAGPLILVASIPFGSDSDVLDQLYVKLMQDPDIAQVTPPKVLTNKQVVVMTIYPKSAPQDSATDVLIKRLRTEIIPPVIGSSNIQVYVGGVVATFYDVGVVLTEKLPTFVLSVLLLSFLLLMIVFRSLLIAVKAVVMNVLAIGAAFGVVVLIFQWGWGQGLLGNKGGPIESYLPLTLFAILFGLSMDYEIFLVTRIQEEWQRTGDNSQAVRRGLSETGGVITSAAAIMFSVFLTFAFGQERIIKEFGIGLATAVAVDATLIRMILVPALMQIWGKANWWLPALLDKWLPKVKI